ncbi:MAG: hypothetical protein AAGA53_04985 [Pseudomonadota bacterium]
MLKRLRNLTISMLVLVGAGVSTPALSEEVYMIRGFLNVFSDGMNQMTRQLKAKGIRAKAISNGDWRNVASDIIKRSKQKKVSYPIVIAGHSLGGVEAPSFANTLGAAGVPVELVIGLDPGFSSPPPFRKGARQVVNYKIPSGKNYRRGPGFKGKITTIDVSKFGTDHVGIDKNKRVQALVINRIRKTVRK